MHDECTSEKPSSTSDGSFGTLTPFESNTTTSGVQTDTTQDTTGEPPDINDVATGRGTTQNAEISTTIDSRPALQGKKYHRLSYKHD